MKFFSKDYIQFFKELEKNNNKEWFDENRKRYEQEVKKPFQNFVGHLIDKASHVDPEIHIKPSDAIMRINKDFRFSKEKIPYNTYNAAIISKTGKKSKEYPGIYLQMGADNILIFGGAYTVEKESLYNIRNSIKNDESILKKVLNNKDFKEKFGELQGEKNKILPPEFKEAAKEEPLIANKNFYCMAELDSSNILKDDLDEIIMSYYKAAKPVNDYLKSAMYQ